MFTLILKRHSIVQRRNTVHIRQRNDLKRRINVPKQLCTLRTPIFPLHVHLLMKSTVCEDFVHIGQRKRGKSAVSLLNLLAKILIRCRANVLHDCNRASCHDRVKTCLLSEGPHGQVEYYALFVPYAPRYKYTAQ